MFVKSNPYKKLNNKPNFKLYISPYQLQFKKKHKAPLQGTLLAFEFDQLGYSDFLPWPQFGEKNLKEQLKDLQKGKESVRFQIAKQNAWIDAQARSKKQNLFFGIKIPKSHFLISEPSSFSNFQKLSDERYKIIKIKLSHITAIKELNKLKEISKNFPQLKWRIDLNGGSWKFWRKKIDFLKPQIDFIEDPLEKKGFSKTEKNLMAEDWKISSFQIKIIKPSRDSINNLIKKKNDFAWKRIIFTHSLDHPLGQLTSAFWAGKFYQLYPNLFETGGFTHSLFLENSYNLKSGLHFKPPSGFGFGFGELLKKEKWKRWL